MSDHPHVAVIVVSWNNANLLPACLASVSAQTFPSDRLHTYVIDNGSTDGSQDVIRSVAPAARVVELRRNSGFAIANNVGIAKARAEHPIRYVVLLNSDAALAPDWVQTLVGFASSRPKGACFQSLTLDGVDRSRVDSTHLFVDPQLQAHQAGYATLAPGAHRTQRVFGVNAAAAMYSTAFLDAQPFREVLDERMWMYLEDVDLSTRALVMGWENWTVAGTTAEHLGSASTKQRTSGFAIRKSVRNQPILWLTNFPLAMIVRNLPAIVRHDAGSIRHLRATGQSDVVAQLLLGRLEGLLQIPYALRRRAQLRPDVRLPDESLALFMATGTLIT